MMDPSAAIYPAVGGQDQNLAAPRISGTIYRGTERISSNALLNALEVGPDPVLRQRVAKRPKSFNPSPSGRVFPELLARRCTGSRADRECDTLQESDGGCSVRLAGADAALDAFLGAIRRDDGRVSRTRHPSFVR